MNVKGIAWAGVKTAKFDEMVSFFKDVLNLEAWIEVDDLVTFRMPNGDLMEILGPTMAPELESLKGPKVDFYVDDVDAAVAELTAKGCQIAGNVHRDESQNWVNFYAPDGNLFGLTNLFTHPLRKFNNDEILFYGPHEPYGFLGNWYSAAIFLDGKIWPTSEHYYQAQKFAGTEFEEICRRLPSPREAFELTRRPDVPVDAHWDEKKLDVMKIAVKAKFTQNPELAERLLETGNAQLIENAPIDAYWGIGANGNGKNMLGKILMDLRDLLRR